VVPVIRTTRLRLDVPDLTDFPVWADILCSPRAAYMDGPYSRDDAYTEFAAMVGTWLLHGHGVFAMRPRDGATAIGFVCLNLEPGDHEPELGFFVTEATEGQGLVAEAALAVRDWARGQGIRSLVSYVDPANERSVRLATRLGARRDPLAEAAYDGTPGVGVAVFRHWAGCEGGENRRVAQTPDSARVETEGRPKEDARTTSEKGE
jgi:RimJ/RimL family protein N-acetyltransferase